MTRGSFLFEEKPQGGIEKKLTQAHPLPVPAWPPGHIGILWALGVNGRKRPGFLLGGGGQEGLGGTVRPGCPGTAPSLQF